MADPIRSTNVVGVLTEFVRLVFEKFGEVPCDAELKPLLIAPRSSIVLPAFFYYMPIGIWQSAAPYYRFFDNLRSPQEANFPLLAISGRGTRQIITLGGGVALNVSFRLYLIVALPPSQDIVERLSLTAGHLARVALSIFHHPPFWYFVEVNEEDVLVRGDGGDYSICYIGGNIRGMPHVIPGVLTDS